MTLQHPAGDVLKPGLSAAASIPAAGRHAMPAGAGLAAVPHRHQVLLLLCLVPCPLLDVLC